MPICRQCFAGQTVTVLGFGEVFATASISDTMAALSKRVKAQSHMFAVKVFDYEEKENRPNHRAGILHVSRER